MRWEGTGAPCPLIGHMHPQTVGKGLIFAARKGLFRSSFDPLVNPDHDHGGLKSSILLLAGSQLSQRAKGVGERGEIACLMYFIFLDELKPLSPVLRVTTQKGQVFGLQGTAGRAWVGALCDLSKVRSPGWRGDPGLGWVIPTLLPPAPGSSLLYALHPHLHRQSCEEFCWIRRHEASSRE